MVIKMSFTHSFFFAFSHCKYSKCYQSPEDLYITSTVSHLRKYIFLIITVKKETIDCDFVQLENCIA